MLKNVHRLSQNSILQAIVLSSFDMNHVDTTENLERISLAGLYSRRSKQLESIMRSDKHYELISECFMIKLKHFDD